MDLILPAAHAYAESYSSPGSDLLAELELFTKATHAQAHMLSGQLQGRFLAMASRLLAPRFILEIGTFTGYSALCLAEGLQPGGVLHTIELREEDAQTAESFFARSPFGRQIHLHRGAAVDIIPTLPYQWDLVFIDADKTSYLEYYELVLPQLRTGGMILADNVLFHGQVLENPVKGKNAKAIQAFNEHVKNDPRVDKIMLTLRDGLFLLLKK